MNPAPNVLPLIGLQAWLEVHSLAELPPEPVRKGLQGWMEQRMSLAQAQLQEQIRQVHHGEEPKRPWLTVEFSDGPGSFPDPNWISPEEARLRDRLSRWEAQGARWGDARNWTWAEVLERQEAWFDRELSLWEGILQEKIWVGQSASPQTSFDAASKQLKHLLAAPPDSHWQSWAGQWRDLAEFSSQLDHRVLQALAASRKQEFETMAQTAAWSDRLFNIMVGATVFGEVYHSERSPEYGRRAKAYGELATGTKDQASLAWQDFLILEHDPELADLLAHHRVDSAVLRYGVGSLLVLLSAWCAAYVTGALGLSEGGLMALGSQSSRLLATRLTVQSSSFVLSHRALSSLVLGAPAFGGPELSPEERARDLGEEILITALMFYFLGGTHEAFLRHGGAKMRPWAQNLGAFATENSAFAAWQLAEGTYRTWGKGPAAWEAMSDQTLSAQGWLDRLFFLGALRMGSGAARGILGEITAIEEPSDWASHPTLWQWSPAGGKAALEPPPSITLMSASGPGGKGGRGKYDRPPPSPRTKDPDQPLSQRALDTILKPGRLPRGNPERLKPDLIAANAKVMSSWRSETNESQGPTESTSQLWTTNSAKWVRLFLDRSGRLLQVSSHPGRGKRQGLPPPKGRGLAVDALVDPESGSLIWFDHRLGGLGAYLGGRPLDAMTALWQGGRTYRESLSTDEGMAVAFRVAQTLDPVDWHRELLGEFAAGPFIRDLLPILGSGEAGKWTSHALYLYRERGLLRIAKTLPPHATEHGRVKIKVLREGSNPEFMEMKRGQLQAGNLNRFTLQEYDEIMVWLQGKLGELPTLIQETRQPEAPPSPPKPGRWSTTKRALREWWARQWPWHRPDPLPPPSPPVQVLPPLIEWTAEGIRVLSLPPGTKVVSMGGRDIKRSDLPEDCIRITRLEDGSHFLEISASGPTILVNDLAVGPGRWVMISHGDWLTLGPQAVYRFIVNKGPM